MSAIVPVQQSINNVAWGEFDSDAIAALTPLEASGIAASLFSGLKRAGIASMPTVSQSFGGPEAAVWKTFDALRARGNGA